MGVTAKNLGTLSGPHEEMASEAQMEMWSLPRTQLSSSLNQPTPTENRSGTVCRAAKPTRLRENPALDPKTSRAQEDCVLTSSPMELRHASSLRPVAAGFSSCIKSGRRQFVAIFDQVRLSSAFIRSTSDRLRAEQWPCSRVARASLCIQTELPASYGRPCVERAPNGTISFPRKLPFDDFRASEGADKDENCEADSGW